MTTCLKIYAPYSCLDRPARIYNLVRAFVLFQKQSDMKDCFRQSLFDVLTNLCVFVVRAGC